MNLSPLRLQNGDRFFVDAKGVWSGGLGADSGPSGKMFIINLPLYSGEPSPTALIGQVGAGPMFSVGNQYLGQASQSGQLSLRMNDPLTGDNSGYLTVDVYAQSGSASQSSSPRVIIQHVPVPMEKKPDWR